MAKVKSINADKPYRPRPAIDPEDRENQVIAAAVNLAEKQLLEGTASAAVIVHYLKQASLKERKELEKLELEKELLVAKTEALQSQKRMDELYANAIAAMKSYSGQNEDDENA